MILLGIQRYYFSTENCPPFSINGSYCYHLTYIMVEKYSNIWFIQAKLSTVIVMQVEHWASEWWCIWIELWPKSSCKLNTYLDYWAPVSEHIRISDIKNSHARSFELRNTSIYQTMHLRMSKFVFSSKKLFFSKIKPKLYLT